MINAQRGFKLEFKKKNNKLTFGLHNISWVTSDNIHDV